METTPPPPNPDRPAPPDGWSDDQWTVYRVLSGGGTVREAAGLVDKSSGTVSKWVKAWRRSYGEDLFRDARPSKLTPTTAETTRADVSAPKTTAANALAERWATRREVAARGLGHTGDVARAKALAAIELLDPRQLDAYGILALAKASQILFREADRLAAIHAPTSGQAASGIGGKMPAPVDLDEMGELGRADRLATVLQLGAQVRARREAIDVRSAEAGAE